MKFEIRDVTSVCLAESLSRENSKKWTKKNDLTRVLSVIVVLWFFSFEVNGQFYTHNFDNIGTFNPAAIAQRDYHSISFLGRTNFNQFVKEYNTLINAEFELPDSVSAVGFHTNIIRNSYSGIPYSSKITEASFVAGYRYRFEYDENVKFTPGLSVRHYRYKRTTDDYSPGFTAPADLDANFWSLNAGVLIDLYGLNLSISANNVNQPTIQFYNEDVLLSERKILRNYDFHLAYDHKPKRGFKVRPQLYWGITQHSPPSIQINLTHNAFASIELTHYNRFYWTPGFRVLFVGSNHTFTGVSLNMGGIVNGRMQIGLASEYLFYSSINYFHAEAFLKYRLRK